MLDLTVFCSGALVMVLEMAGGRVLAPYVGTSAIVWTSLIGVVLAFLALGSWAGGRYADRHLSQRGLRKALLGAGLGCAVTAFCHTAICANISGAIGNLYVAAVGAAIGVFAIPAFFFGMITPYVARLRLASLDTAGATVGRLYALSTAGSILGTFLGGFILISWFSSTTILWSAAGCMIVLALLNNLGKPAIPALLLLVFAFLCWQDKSYAEWLVNKGGQRLIESPYNSIRVLEGVDRGRAGAPVRLMATDPGYSQSGMILSEPDKLYFDYTRFYGLGPKNVPEAKKLLMLGGGGFSVPKWLLSDKNNLAAPGEIDLTVVELDPAMTQTARDFFKLKDDPRMKIVHEDARAFLNHQKEQYDLIFVDVFNSHYSVPFQMGTRQAAKALAKALSPDGMLLMNIISAVEGGDGRLLRSIYNAFKESFPDIRVYCVGQPDNPAEVQNLMLAAFKSPRSGPAPQGINRRSMDPPAEEIARMEDHLYKKEIPADVEALDDDFAPVDRYTLMLTKD